MITPGRSGSTFLQIQLNRLYGVYAEESYFTITQAPLQCYTSMFGQSEEYQNQFIKTKIKWIEGLKCNHYVDSVSLTCQNNIIERYIDQGYMPNVITLRRDPRLVAWSYYQLGWDVVNPPLSFVKPSDPNVLRMTLEHPHEYQNCLWYCFEIERLARQYKSKLKSWGAKHYETSLNRILDKNNFDKMTDFLGLPRLGYLYDDKINALDESKYTSIFSNHKQELQEQFIENIKQNNDLDESFLNMDMWDY